MDRTNTRSVPLARTGLALCALLFFLPLSATLSCVPSRGDGPGGALTIAGSTSVQPFAEKLAEEYMAVHPGREINVQGGGSTAGCRAAIDGAAQIGMSSRHLKPDEEKELAQTVIAYDGIALIVNNLNTLRGLSREDIARIFSGEVSRWEQVGGPAGEIHFVTREEGSGTRGAFEEMVMKKRLISARALVQDSNGAVREIVANDPKALGYISLGLVDNRVRALEVDSVAPSRDNIVGKRYAIVRPFLFLTRGAPRGDARAFIDYVLGPEGQKLLGLEGLVPVAP